MKVGLITWYDEIAKKYGDITYNINSKYCEKYNLDIILSTKKLLKNRENYWEKVTAIISNIEKYDYLISCLL